MELRQIRGRKYTVHITIFESRHQREQSTTEHPKGFRRGTPFDLSNQLKTLNRVSIKGRKTLVKKRGVRDSGDGETQEDLCGYSSKSLTKYKKGALGGVEEDDYLVVKVC